MALFDMKTMFSTLLESEMVKDAMTKIEEMRIGVIQAARHFNGRFDALTNDNIEIKAEIKQLREIMQRYVEKDTPRLEATSQNVVAAGEFSSEFVESSLAN